MMKKFDSHAVTRTQVLRSDKFVILGIGADDRG